MYYIRIIDHIRGVLVMKFSLAIDKIKTSLGAGDARAPAKFRGSEKRKERKIDNLLVGAPPDLKSYLRLSRSQIREQMPGPEIS